LVISLGALAFAPHAGAAVSCPNANPVVNENNCKGAGTTAWELADYDPNLGGFATSPSVDVGQSVTLKIGRNAPLSGATVDISVYRMGYYGGTGGRLVQSGSATVNNTFACGAMDATTGKVDCGNWSPTYTIPGSALQTSGVYLAKLSVLNQQTEVVFTVRDDARNSRMLYILPRTTYEAYNLFGGKNLYFGTSGGTTPASGTDRAVKVSFNRPSTLAGAEQNWFFGPDQNLLSWLEQQGYDVAYTDDLRAGQDPNSLKDHDVDVISGHAEYWSQEYFNAVKAARDAGVSIASFSGNTAYWKVRYEDGGQTLVCYKTVEGGGSSGSGTISQNDWGPDGVKNTADDALGADGVAGTADDNPQNATTTFRDNGAPPGDPNAPAGGRVGPDMPENQLFGSMYVGDNDARYFPVTVPAGNANDEYAGDRIWRNTGIATNGTTNIGTDLVGWEWDTIPTQAQYTSREPAGVKRVTATNVQVASDNSWLQDEGRARNTTPPPGQPGTVSAVKYTAPSGALVFAAGNMRWSLGLSDNADPRIQQATYNVVSDMGVQPDTPTGITLDPGGSNRAPVASFTIASNPTRTNQTVTYNASASSDSDGTIAKYEWDLDGNGSFETDTGTNPVATHAYGAEGAVDVRLRVTDNQGATDLQVKTLTVIDNQPPTAAVTASPNPTVVGQTVTLDSSGSSDPDGTIVNHEWDLDGNGTYETATGASATTTKSWAATGTVSVKVRVTDNGGKTAIATVPVTVNQGGLSNYGDAVLRTSGLQNYWRMGESSGATFADSKGTSNATLFNGVTLGVPGGPPGDPNTAARFDGSDDNARASVDLSGKTAVTVEFWMKWTFGNDDRLAMEFTPNYHDNAGGFIVDPNAPQLGGQFAVAIGSGAAQNSAYFARPSSGDWHHYAFVLNSAAPAAQQITPYVDGVAVTYTKYDSGTGAGPFASSTLYMMSRAGTALFGNGDLDELAIYDRALSAATISEHAASFGTNRRPIASFTASANPAAPGQTVTYNASGSSDPDGSIVRYEWDLDGNGSFETDTGTTPSATKSYATEGDVDVGLRVTDNGSGADTTTKTETVIANQAPTASFTASPNPAILGQTTTFNASASSDSDGTIAKYEWDLDGNGSYETDTGTSPTATKQYASTGTTTVGLRVTDNGGKAATKTLPVTVNAGGVSSYGDAVTRTPGLVSYWRMGEAAGGSAFADSKGPNTASAFGNVTLGVPGGVAGDPNTAARFDGTSAYARANLDLSQTRTATVEFWLKWNAYAGDDRLAMEFTPNFNNSAGGFIVDPNAPQNGGSFGVGIGTDATRNNVFFSRPSAGAWHHYAFVLDSTQSAAQQVTPYVDGQPVSYTKLDNGTGAGSFANSVLYFMSRAGQSLFGAGDLDEVAVYDRALSASTISEHFSDNGTNRRPIAAFTSSPAAPKPGQTVSFNASGSSDPDGSIVKYEWDLDGNGTYETDTGTTPTVSKTYASAGDVDVHLRVYDNDNGTDVATKTLSIGNAPPTASFTATPNPTIIGRSVAFDASASGDADGTIAKYEWDLDGNGSYETDTGTTATTSKTYAAAGSVTVGLRVTDDNGAATTATKTVTVTTAGSPPTAAFTATPNPSQAGQTVSFNGSASNDPDGPIAKYEWDLDGNGSFETDTGTTATTSTSYASPGTVPVALRVTDADGMTDTVTNGVAVNGTGTTYASKQLATAGLSHYWRMGDPVGSTTLADAKGSSPVALSGGPTLGAPGAINGDSDTSVAFDGVNDTAAAPVDLSSTNKTTVEFWLKWNAFAGDDALAMELTPNFNDGPGGFLVDPNTPGGTFGVALGVNGSRNNAFFTRPSAGAWHHYALVFDSAAPAASQITPYVDGAPVSYTKGVSGTGAGNFANSSLYLMSRGGSAAWPTGASLFGAGGLDDVSVYTRALTASEIATQYSGSTNSSPTASFTASPNPATTGQAVSFNASASSDPDGTIAKYEWDLDGNGSYETDTGTTATTSKTYATAGPVTVGLRVTDNQGATATTTRSLSVNQGANTPPSASFTAAPNPATTGQAVAFDASASADTDGAVARYEWDLDGNGSYETDTGATKTTSKTYATSGSVTVGLRVTDNQGATATTTRALTVTNRAPTASFTVSPSPAATRQSVTFDGGASTDPDGTVAKYEWDLDGNGSYETNGGAVATTTKTFSTVGAVTIGLRVTDDKGATATTTRSLTVQSAYANLVTGTAGLRGYWRLADAGTTAADASTSANPGTYTNGPVSAPTGLLVGETNAARTFDGTNDFVNLAPGPFGTPTRVSAEAWVRTAATKGSGGYHFLISDSSSDFNNGFTLAIDSSNRATFAVASNALVRGQATTTVTLAPNTIHHVAGTYDGSRVRVYVDGVERANVAYSSGITWNAARDLYLGSRVASSGQSTSYLNGTLDEPAIYTVALSAANVLAHYNAGK
jgi:PKD repeat protein